MFLKSSNTLGYIQVVSCEDNKKELEGKGFVDDVSKLKSEKTKKPTKTVKDNA